MPTVKPDKPLKIKLKMPTKKTLMTKDFPLQKHGAKVVVLDMTHIPVDVFADYNVRIRHLPRKLKLQKYLT
jgi:hypothetical protein